LKDSPRVAVVGPCASGKTTVAARLMAMGYNAFSAAQEHAGVRTLWQRRHPQVVIYLDGSIEAVRKRRDVGWGPERLQIQRERLADARAHAALYILTDRFSPDRVAGAARVIIEGVLRRHGGRHDVQERTEEEEL